MGGGDDRHRRIIGYADACTVCASEGHAGGTREIATRERDRGARACSRIGRGSRR